MAPPKLLTPSRRKTSIVSPRSTKSKTKAVDLVTGKTTVEYFFDPSLLLAGAAGSETPVKAPKDSSDPQYFASKHLFVPCTIIKPLDEENNSGKTKGQPYPGPTLVKTSDGVLHKISDSTKLLALKAPDDYIGMDDVLHLPQITEASLVHTLRLRYRRDDIYTSAGPILISINPYKAIKAADGSTIYSDDLMMLYRNKVQYEYDEKPPHLFQIADRAYTALLDSVHSNKKNIHLEDVDPLLVMESPSTPGNVLNQSIIISGESGSGKTEATKIIMKYLARITRRLDKPSIFQSPDGKMIAALEDRVLSSNPILEAFGNAQTLRNDNSSRFGKFIHIYFSTRSGSITGASITNYLLEKTRITTQNEGEQNYHIFYQLILGASDSLRQELGLSEGCSSFAYLGNRPSSKNYDKYGTDLEETRTCLTSIGLTEQEQNGVFAITAAVLHLGNIQFEADDGDIAKISTTSMASLTKACDLLGINEAKMSEAILTKLIVVNGKGITKPQNVSMAQDKRDALAKMTYSCLFLWLVSRVNEMLEQTSNHNSLSSLTETDKFGFIGVLDIYGFESFEVNGFEQLLINYCNEKLQRHFNRHLFEVEQELYANEGVDWSYITFNDNRPCLELIEGSGGTVGILSCLDDAWGAMGPASEKDAKFVTHLHKLFGTTASDQDGKKTTSTGGPESGHRNFITPKFGKDFQFIIVHYAGEVRYSVQGFVDKNMETLSNELRELGEESSKPMSQFVYACAGDGASSIRSTLRGVSVSSQFRTSLQSLVSDLERTQPHYVRCIKPNSTKAPGTFLTGEVLKQLRYSGMMEAIRIRREGYALREDHASFFDRFSVLLSSNELAGGCAGIVELVDILSKRLTVSNADWQVGHSKIFLRRELSEKLERLAKLRVHAAARTLCRFGAQAARIRLARMLVTWIRFRLRMLRIYRRNRACSKISANFRRFKQVRFYKKTKRAFIALQCQQRRLGAIQVLRKLRDPFCDMSFKDCKRLLTTEQMKLQEAVTAKDFRLASELEKRIDAIEQAVERKRPLTRAVLDERIIAVQEQLDDAVRRKSFAECHPFQEKLEELVGLRAQMPTIEELRSAVKTAESDVAEAAKSRDFSRAAECQTLLESAKRRLSESLAAADNDEAETVENDVTLGFDSRAQLESGIANISSQIKAAIDAKDFSTASFLQKSLDEREKLRLFFPTLAELEMELTQASQALDTAVNRKDFAEAGKMNATVEEIKRRISLEREKSGQHESTGPPFVETTEDRKMAFESRADLEKEILTLSKKVSAAVSKKDFKGADSYQVEVDKMTALRTEYPTLEELQSMCAAKKLQMDSAIASKNFAKADEIHQELERIEKRLDKEMSRSGSVPIPKQTMPRVASVTMKSLPAKLQPSAASVASVKSSVSNASPTGTRGTTQEISSVEVRSVAKLRPAVAIKFLSTETIVEFAKTLAGRRTNAGVIVDVNERVVGILTDTDMTRRVVAKNVDPAITNVFEVMTPNPMCVSTTDSAMDALTTMVENHFRHLPVVDNMGSVVGLLDIAKCLNDAISKLERSQSKGGNSAEDALKQVVSQQGGNSPQAEVLQALLGDLILKAFGSRTTPTLRSLLAGKPRTVVSPSTSIRDAGLVMAESRKAALIVDDVSGSLVGIFGFKDMMCRAVAKELPLDLTPVRDVMTPNPETVAPDITVLEALQTMHDNHFLTLPVCEQDGRVVGIVDVMDVIYGCGGAEGWRSIFGSAMDMDDSSVHQSTYRGSSSLTRASVVFRESPIHATIPSTLEFDTEGNSTIGDERVGTILKTYSSDDRSMMDGLDGPVGIFKITSPTGETHKIRCEVKYEELLQAVSEKVLLSPLCIQMSYVDEEGDPVVITTDDDVSEAWSLAMKTTVKIAKLSVLQITPKTTPGSSTGSLVPIPPSMATTAAAASGIGLALLVSFSMVLLRSTSKKS